MSQSDSLSELDALLTLLKRHGVSRYTTGSTAVEFQATPQIVFPVSPAGEDEAEKSQGETKNADEAALYYAVGG